MRASKTGGSGHGRHPPIQSWAVTKCRQLMSRLPYGFINRFKTTTVEHIRIQSLIRPQGPRSSATRESVGDVSVGPGVALSIFRFSESSSSVCRTVVPPRERPENSLPFPHCYILNTPT